jgi:hypothetical protein
MKKCFRVIEKLYPVLKAGAELDNQMPLIPADRLQVLRAL